LVDHQLSGLIIGLTLSTKPEEIYRAIVESTAYGARKIVQTFNESGVPVKEFIAAGGLIKNSFVMQIYADVLNMPITIIKSAQGPALGSAIHAAVAAGAYKDVQTAAAAMGGVASERYKPNPASAKVYNELYAHYKALGYAKTDIYERIQHEIKIDKILKKASERWDGGYAMAGLLGHGSAFVLRDPNGIRPAFWYEDDEICVVASERPVIQTAFNLKEEQIQELQPGHALIIEKKGEVKEIEINAPKEIKKCSFERIYFSRGSDSDIYKERKALGRLIVQDVLESVGHDYDNSVFSFIPNTAEVSFYGLIKGLEEALNADKIKQLAALGGTASTDQISEIVNRRARIEKIAIKDAKLRTFITQDDSRDDLVAHVYDITYGSVRRGTDNLIVIDDSIVRGTTLRQSILRILDRLGPKKIVVVDYNTK
jgi:hypothetical protein